MNKQKKRDKDRGAHNCTHIVKLNEILLALSVVYQVQDKYHCTLPEPCISAYTKVLDWEKALILQELFGSHFFPIFP